PFLSLGRREAAMTSVLRLIAGLLLLSSLAAPAAGGERGVVSSVTGRREHVGECFTTRVERVGPRNPNGSTLDGVDIAFEDGHYNVSHDDVAAIDAARPGDR